MKSSCPFALHRLNRVFGIMFYSRVSRLFGRCLINNAAKCTFQHAFLKTQFPPMKTSLISMAYSVSGLCFISSLFCFQLKGCLFRLICGLMSLFDFGLYFIIIRMWAYKPQFSSLFWDLWAYISLSYRNKLIYAHKAQNKTKNWGYEI